MGKLTNCKACKKEISRGAKRCPSCSHDQRNFFMRYKIITGVTVLLVIAFIKNGGDFTTPPVVTNDKVIESAPVISSTKTVSPKIKTYSDGTYLVNKDMGSGLYRVTLNNSALKMGYVERAKDATMEANSIIANIILTGNGYVEIAKTDVAVKLKGVTIEPIKIKELKPSIKTEAADGIYLVGYDLAIGVYKVALTDTTTKMGYVERSRSVSMGVEDTIANEIVKGPGYVKIIKGDFAVRLQGVKITIQK
ncbi:hypothetical protein [Clostridium lacusfryxellense]|uniref:hypothetical protein n=1 Tax=Clostridium lacusfryxellense TaxID=205328 RepID=UPI001C0DB162|nr:hypothetical protein [Clostridium lacusfryxellense]MBU3110996.1 hypothetical protein [Clostridium lacusfryxellense]